MGMLKSGILGALFGRAHRRGYGRHSGYGGFGFHRSSGSGLLGMLLGALTMRHGGGHHRRRSRFSW